jgi:hypothetical protein
MYKLLDKMGPKSLTNLFSFKSEKTNYLYYSIPKEIREVFLSK